MPDNPTRRDALKALAAATGAVTLASLPTRWAKPDLHVGAVPAHAQTSDAQCYDLIIEYLPANVDGFPFGQAAYSGGLPVPPDEGFATPSLGESGIWRWYCGLDSGCFTMLNIGEALSTVGYRLTSRDGTFFQTFVSGIGADFYFDATTGTLYVDCPG